MTRQPLLPTFAAGNRVHPTGWGWGEQLMPAAPQRPDGASSRPCRAQSAEGVTASEVPSAKPWPEGAASHAVMNCGPPASHGGQATPACPKASQHGRTRVHGSHAYANAYIAALSLKGVWGSEALRREKPGWGVGCGSGVRPPNWGRFALEFPPPPRPLSVPVPRR